MGNAEAIKKLFKYVPIILMCTLTSCNCGYDKSKANTAMKKYKLQGGDVAAVITGVDGDKVYYTYNYLGDMVDSARNSLNLEMPQIIGNQIMTVAVDTSLAASTDSTHNVIRAFSTEDTKATYKVRENIKWWHQYVR